MKKLSKLYLFLILGCANLISLSGCTGGSSSSKEIKQPTSIYSDSPDFEFNNWKFKHYSTYCGVKSGTSNFELETKYRYTNDTSVSRVIELKSLSLIRESDGASYTTYYNLGSTLGSPRVRVEPGITANLRFTATIPSRITEENYRFDFTFDDASFSLHLYSKPDELRKDCQVTRYLDGELLDITSQKEGRRAYEVFYNWHSDDWAYACRTWFTDPGMTSDASYVKISDGLTLYGSKVKTLMYSENESEDNSLVVTGIWMTTQGDDLFIPKTADGKPVGKLDYGSMECIPSSSPFSYLTGPTVLHLPKGITMDRPFDKGTTIRKVYFEGNADEWNAAYSGKSLKEALIEVVYNQFEEK